jgi:hypothetical protein
MWSMVLAKAQQEILADEATLSTLSPYLRHMDNDELIKKMRGRVEQCRRLARSTTDAYTSAVLTQMADDGEADIQRLLAEGTTR